MNGMKVSFCDFEVTFFIPICEFLGPQLPIELAHLQLINTVDGLLAIGGHSVHEGHDPHKNNTGSIYYLSCSNDTDDLKSSCKWKKYKKSLSIPRHHHLVIPLTDSYAQKLCKIGM